MGRTPIRWVLPCRFAMRWPRCERKELPGKSEVGKWKLEKRTKSDAPFEFLTESSQYYGLWLVHARTWSVSISRGRRRPDGALRGYGDLNERSTRFCTVLSKKTLHADTSDFCVVAGWHDGARESARIRLLRHLRLVRAGVPRERWP